ncbi:NAD(P)-binding protein [Mycena chlorophos]|uniref:NAD(P)-binding protein n=1 Tax=Mycena chlorophos TaxID=658473 RepID=A0A8H6SVJ4_MYCCL|nr:NAD(P)-binding protein [Mycena chlorophos]
MSPRVWLVTGANSGLGLALVEHALAQGDQVIAAIRNPASIPDSIKAAKPLTLDLNASDSDIQRAGKAALDIYGRIDVLVNNAGYCLTGYVEEVQDADIKHEFQTNFFGAISLTQSLLPAFRSQRSGYILNLSSVAGIDGHPPFAMYNASKAALEAMTEALHTELLPFNVTALIIEPGYFPTNFWSSADASRIPPARLTGAYPETDSLFNTMPKKKLEEKQVGDRRKAVARIFELVSGTGHYAQQSVNTKFVRVVLGPDAGTRIRSKLKLILENVDGTEEVWRSTNMDEETLEKYARGEY